jgi:hypothetical protein
VGTLTTAEKIKPTSGTHFELVPKQAGIMTLQNYQNLSKQVQVFPFNT